MRKLGKIGRKGIRKCSKVKGFSLALVAVFVLSQTIDIMDVKAATSVYLDESAGDNSNSGNSPEEAVRSWDKANQIVENGGMIYVRRDGEWIAIEIESTVTDEVIVDTEEESQVPEIEVEPEVIDEPVAIPEELPAEAPEVIEEPVVDETTEEVKDSEVVEPAEETKGDEAEVVADEADTNEVQQDTEEELTIPEETKSDDSELPVEEVKADSEEPKDLNIDVDEETKGSSIVDTEVSADELTGVLEQLTFMVEEQLDIDNILDATKAYETLDKKEQEDMPEEAFKRLRVGQLVVGNVNRTSNGITVLGDLPWYVEFRATKGNSQDGGTFDLGELIGTYELSLWNTLANQPYELEGQEVTVTIPVEDLVKYKDISVIHYLEDGSHEVLNPTRVEGTDTISFVTTSFSSYSIAGNELVGNLNEVYEEKSDNQQGSAGDNNSQRDGSSGSSSSGNRTSTNRSTGARTGDTTQIAWFLGISALAAVVIGGMLVFKKKREKSEK